ncbi:HTH domain-containing protein [Sporosarcina gallistercoris]|uniref:helix-turn-helix transcriptional regulator n=1 Tax=Sporosarcina gallistercoris TaxID=2762245 RepID=UPI003D28179B
MKSRQLEILLYLLKTKKTTHRDLAEAFEVSVKTIQRDVDRLSVQGIPVYTKQGNDGGIYIEPSYKLSRSFFTKKDLQTVIFALSLFDQISHEDKMTSILSKLALIEPDFVHLLEQDASEYFVVDVVDEPVSMEEGVYAAINTCFDSEQLLQLTVKGKVQTVAPISYVLRSDGLHLYAYGEDYCLLPLADVTEFEILDREFERDFEPYHSMKKVFEIQE